MNVYDTTPDLDTNDSSISTTNSGVGTVDGSVCSDETSYSGVRTVNEYEHESLGVGTNEEEYTVNISAMEVPRRLDDNLGAYRHNGTTATNNEQYVLTTVESNGSPVL